MDSTLATVLQGMFVEEAAALRDAGYTLEEAVEALKPLPATGADWQEPLKAAFRQIHRMGMSWAARGRPPATWTTSATADASAGRRPPPAPC